QRLDDLRLVRVGQHRHLVAAFRARVHDRERAAIRWMHGLQLHGAVARNAQEFHPLTPNSQLPTPNFQFPSPDSNSQISRRNLEARSRMAEVHSRQSSRRPAIASNLYPTSVSARAAAAV